MCVKLTSCFYVVFQRTCTPGCWRSSLLHSITTPTSPASERPLETPRTESSTFTISVARIVGCVHFDISSFIPIYVLFSSVVSYLLLNCAKQIPCLFLDGGQSRIWTSASSCSMLRTKEPIMFRSAYNY